MPLYTVDGIEYTSKQAATKAARRLLVSFVGRVITPTDSLFPVLLQHPQATQKLYKDGRLKSIKVRGTNGPHKAEIVIDDEEMSLNKCFYNVKPWRDWGEYQRVYSACRTTVASFVRAWKVGHTECAHCGTDLPANPTDWDADHNKVEFAGIVHEWVAQCGKFCSTVPNPNNATSTRYYYKFGTSLDASSFYEFHKAKATDMVPSCKTCNRTKKKK